MPASTMIAPVTRTQVRYDSRCSGTPAASCPCTQS